MGSLGDYKACLQYFTEHAAKAASTKHWAKRSWRPRTGRGATGGGVAASMSVEASASSSERRRARGVRRVTSGGKKTPSKAAKFGAGRALAARFAYA